MTGQGFVIEMLFILNRFVLYANRTNETIHPDIHSAIMDSR